MTIAQQKTMTERDIDKQISNIVGTLTDPIVYHRGQEGRPPEWLREAITIQRLIENMAALKEGRDPTGTDAECCWYLSTASLDYPFDSDWTEIYKFVFNKTYGAFRSKEANNPIPEDLRQETLSEYQMRELRHLKHWIYRVRCERRLELNRAERHQARDIAKEKEKEENPTLFDFFTSQVPK